MQRSFGWINGLEGLALHGGIDRLGYCPRSIADGAWIGTGMRNWRGDTIPSAHERRHGIMNWVGIPKTHARKAV